MLDRSETPDPLVSLPLDKDERKWVWEVHKNCDQLLHQRLASFTAAQAMTLASFSVLTVARFNAAAGMPEGRLELLDKARVGIAFFGLFLAFVGWLVTYPMFKRLNYLNYSFLFRDKTYQEYYDCIKWDEDIWNSKTNQKAMFLLPFHKFFPLYKNFIPLWLPIVEGLFWLALLRYLVIALGLQPVPLQPLLGLENPSVAGRVRPCRYQENTPQLLALGFDASKLPLCGTTP